MPSDPRVRLALDALKRPKAEFRAFLASTLARAEEFLAAATASPEAHAQRLGAELGCFAEGRLAVAGFAAVLARTAAPASASGLAAVERSAAHLRRLLAQGDGLFLRCVPAGSDPGACATEALAEAGAGFAMARTLELVRGGRWDAALDPGSETLPFEQWTRSERRLAPPLVLCVAGRDLHAAGLAELCDGRTRLVLVVEAPCPPAPLVRLISPGTFVLQTGDGAGLDRLLLHEGPAIAALVPEGAAGFLHDPAAGKETWQRLSAVELPDPPRRAIGNHSSWQMAEELQQLAALARTPFQLPGSGSAVAPAFGSTEAVDRLAAWLLEQTQPQISP
jgi:hypothetical protein